MDKKCFRKKFKGIISQKSDIEIRVLNNRYDGYL